jgi:hypothetical protein
MAQINLFAALNVAMGEIQSKTTHTKERPDFQAFRDDVVVEIPSGQRIHVILGNHSAPRNTMSGSRRIPMFTFTSLQL